MADKKRYDVELARAGFANGISSQLAEKFNMHKMNDISLTKQEKYVSSKEQLRHSVNSLMH